MARGDVQDMVTRLKREVPNWFGDNHPVVDGILTGVATGLSYAFNFLTYVRNQLRIATAVGGSLDLIGWDFFGPRFQRKKGESDDLWRTRILPEILRPRDTRPAIIQALKNLTGRTPQVIEFTNPVDCGSYGGPYIGYGVAGHWGSVLARTQSLVTAYRPTTTGIPEVPGYGVTTTLSGHVLAGYGITGEYVNASYIQGEVTDAQIYDAVASTQAAGCTAWTQIQS
jgi:hypothetical protein